jgi:hypothetical protein
MRNLDQMIEETLDAEEREILRNIGEEPGFFTQAFGIFGGPAGWVNLLLMFVQGALFIAGVWAAWQFFEAADALTALRYGIPAAVLLLMALIIKIALIPAIQTNRVMRELKLLQLQVARNSQRP